MGILQARTLQWVAMPSSWDLTNPGIEPRSPSLQVDSLPSEPPGKPKNTGVGSLSLLQGIFPTQGWNPGLPHCRQIPAKPPGKHKNTGVGSLTLLLRIFPTQESNWGLRHCRQILYELSYQGSSALETPKSPLTHYCRHKASLGATELTGCSLTTMTLVWGARGRGKMLLWEQKTPPLSPSPPWTAPSSKPMV